MTKKSLKCSLFLIFFLLGVSSIGVGLGALSVLPRTIVALYDGKESKTMEYSRGHRYAQMPLNYLGLTLKFFDIRDGLPDIKKIKGVRGVLVWFRPGTRLPDPEALIQWELSALGEGKQLIIMGDPALKENAVGRATSTVTINRLFERMGLRDDGHWVGVTYNVRIVYQSPVVFGFERKLIGKKPPFEVMKLVDDHVKSYLILQEGDDLSSRSNAVVVGPRGGLCSGLLLRLFLR